jgi:hypothetical protein
MFHGGDDLVVAIVVVVLDLLSFSHPFDVGGSACFGSDNLSPERVGVRPLLDYLVSAQSADVVAWAKARGKLFEHHASFASFKTVKVVWVCFGHSVCMFRCL